MVSPEHLDEQKPENEQVPSPTEEKQALPANKKKRPWLKPLMRAAGIILALGGSFAMTWFAFAVQPPAVDNPEALLIFLLGAISAALYLSWWAILQIPIAFVAGSFVAFYVTPAWYFYMDDAGFGQAMWVIGGPIFAFIGACIGSYLGVLWKKRLPV